MPTTPNREHGELRAPDGIVLEDALSDPTEEGGLRYDGSSFRMKDSFGVFDPRTGSAPPADYAFRRHFLLMGG